MFKKKEEEKVFKVRRGKFVSRLRGMKDILPDEYKYWNLVIKKASELSKAYGFRRVDTPVLESWELFERSSGRSSDVVTKEMFSFIDKNNDKIALRPEATPGIVRAYIEHGMFNLPQPVKLFWLGPVFRHDKPQAGRFRQFSQFNLENIGDLSPVADAELIAITYYFFSELQLEVMFQINSIGCPDCRKEYINKLTEYYKERGKRSRLCNDCKRRPWPCIHKPAHGTQAAACACRRAAYLPCTAGTACRSISMPCHNSLKDTTKYSPACWNFT